MSSVEGFGCFLDPDDINGSVSRYDHIVEIEGCPHIRKATPLLGGVQLYAIADSCCFERQGPFGVCDKPNSSLLYVVARKDFRSRSAGTVKISVSACSENADLLQFVDGSGKVTESLQNADTLVIAPIYKKIRRPSLDWFALEMKKTPGRLLRRVPLTVTAAVRQHEKTIGSMLAILSVAVTAQLKRDVAPVDKTDEDEKGGHVMDELTKTAVSEAVKLLLGDGYSMIKSALTRGRSKDEPQVLRIGAREFTEGSTDSSDARGLIAELQAVEHWRMGRDLQTLLAAYKMGVVKKSIYESESINHSTTYELAEHKYRIHLLDENLESTIKKIYEAVGTLSQEGKSEKELGK